MELSIKITVGCEAALMEALRALAGQVASTAPAVKEVTVAAAEMKAEGGSVPAALAAPAEPAALAAPSAPTAPDAPVDAAAEVRKVMSATRARLNAKAGSPLYASLNAEFVRTARQLGAEKPTALPAEKVGEFKQICDTIMLDADGECLAAPF